MPSRRCCRRTSRTTSSRPHSASSTTPSTASSASTSASNDEAGRVIWLQGIVAGVLLLFLILLGREAALGPIDFAVYHRAALQVIDGNYELYPAEAYGGQPRPSQGFRYLPAVAFVF